MLYAVGQDWLNREHIIGRAVGYLPHVGRITIIMNDYPYVKARRGRRAGFRQEVAGSVYWGAGEELAPARGGRFRR